MPTQTIAKPPVTDFALLHAQAHEAGHAAATKTTPRAIIVGSPSTPFGNDVDLSKQHWYESEGVCGFAWVSFPGNKPWCRWAKKNIRISKHYPSGFCIWVSDYGQSLERKEAYAEAYAKVLREAGVEAYAGSRMD